MGLEIPTLEEHHALEAKVGQLEQRLEKLLRLLQNYESEPEHWRSVSECCQFFYVKNNKPVQPETMKELVEYWIGNGLIQQGTQYLPNPKGGYLINVTFLKGAKLPEYSRVKLKAA